MKTKFFHSEYLGKLGACIASCYGHYFLSAGFDSQNHQMIARIKTAPRMFINIIILSLLTGWF